jgi:hypothetical protein
VAPLSCGFEADGANEGIEIIDNALIEAIKLRSPLGLKPCICFDGAQKACGEWRVDAFEELQEDGQIEYPCGSDHRPVILSAASGRRSPLISIRESSVATSRRSSAVSRRSAAPRFSSSR